MKPLLVAFVSLAGLLTWSLVADAGSAPQLPPCLTSGSPAVTYGCLVTTVVGSGPPDVGDGGAATDASLQEPWDVLVAPDGNIYVSDTQNNRVRRFTPGGTIETVAGTGTAETQDPVDGIPANESQVRFPRGLSFGPDGALFIADHYYVIRRIGTDGIISTVAGNRNPWYSGEGVPAGEASFAGPVGVAVDSEGNIYVADASVNRVRRIGPDGLIWTIAGTGEQDTSGDGGPATQAQLNQPVSLILDEEDGLYIGSWFEDAIRRVDLTTGIISSVPGAYGSHLARDTAGNLFFSSENQVKRWDAVDGAITTIAGTGTPGFTGDGGPAVSATLRNPLGLSVDGSGNVYVVDSGNNRIRRIQPNGLIETVAGGGVIPYEGVPALQAAVYDSQGVGVDHEGNLFFGDFQHRTVRRIGPNGVVTTVAGIPDAASPEDNGSPLETYLGPPIGIVFDLQGNLLFVDPNFSTGVIRLVTTGADGRVDGSLDEQILIVAGQLRFREESDHGAADGGPARNAVFDALRWLTLDSNGTLYVVDAFDNRIRKIVPGSDGIFSGNVDETISTVAGNGIAASSGDGGPATKASLWSPTFVEVDSEDNLYVLEGGPGQLKIRRVDAQTGIITTYADLSQEEQSLNVWTFAFDAQDNLYVAASTQLVRIDAATGERTVVAGTGQAGFSGDGGDARQASFRGLQYLAFDEAGDIYVIDNGNFRIRKITFIPLEDVTATASPTATLPGGQTPTRTPPPPEQLLGDVNCDQTVTAVDSALVLQLDAGLVSSLSCLENGDVNGDGRSNSLDAALILQYVAGLLARLPP